MGVCVCVWGGGEEGILQCKATNLVEACCPLLSFVSLVVVFYHLEEMPVDFCLPTRCGPDHLASSVVPKEGCMVAQSAS